MNVINSHVNHNLNQYSINGSNTKISDNVANNMPNGLLRISEPKDTKFISNNTKNTDLRQIYTPRLAPSTGSLTESFLKSRSNMSPVFKFNEAATRYQMTSVPPTFLKQIKSSIDLII